MEKSVTIEYDTTPEDFVNILLSVLKNLNVEYEVEEIDFVKITYKIKNNC